METGVGDRGEVEGGRRSGGFNYIITDDHKRLL